MLAQALVVERDGDAAADRLQRPGVDRRGLDGGPEEQSRHAAQAALGPDRERGIRAEPGLVRLLEHRRGDGALDVRLDERALARLEPLPGPELRDLPADDRRQPVDRAVVGDGHIATLFLVADDAALGAQALDQLVDQGLRRGARVGVGLEPADADERVEPRGQSALAGEATVDLGEQLGVLEGARRLRGQGHERRFRRPARRVGRRGQDDEPVRVADGAEARHQVGRGAHGARGGDDAVVGGGIVDPVAHDPRTELEQRADAGTHDLRRDELVQDRRWHAARSKHLVASGRGARDDAGMGAGRFDQRAQRDLAELGGGMDAVGLAGGQLEECVLERDHRRHITIDAQDADPLTTCVDEGCRDEVDRDDPPRARADEHRVDRAPAVFGDGGQEGLVARLRADARDVRAQDVADEAADRDRGRGPVEALRRGVPGADAHAPVRDDSRRRTR